MFLVAAVAFRWARADAGFWTIDDAGITYAAAYQLADHGSLAAYVEGTPVESYSNPLLFFVVVLLRLVGLFDPVRTHVHLEMLVFASMITLVWSMLRAYVGQIAALAGAVAFAGLELLTPATWAWYGSGLENVWVSAGLVLLLWICARTARGVALVPTWGAAAFLVAITRPEAPAYVAGFYVALAAFARPELVALRAHVRQVARALAVTTALYLVFLAWRRLGYGDWWPNTYYAKVAGDATLGDHFKGYVLAEVFRYGWSALFAFSVVGLLISGKLEALGQCLVVLLIVSLTLPITAGRDWMGEHRFATAFLAVAHIAYATFFAACIARISTVRSRSWRVGPVFTIVVALAAPVLLACERIAVRDHIALNDVTLGHVARDQGGVRWLHQMRLGLPYPVVMVPDAGGSLLVGGMQFMDSASLADFQQARILKYERSLAARLLAQYQHEEKRPDLVHFNPNSAVVDKSYLGTTYLQAESHLAARSDLVTRAAVDPSARLVFELGDRKVFLSPETVRHAAPGALVRCELIVAWASKVAGPAPHVRVSIDGGDHDEIALAAYRADADTGIEQRGLLIGAPPRVGTYPVVIELLRDGKPAVRATLFELVVTRDTNDLARVATELAQGVPPDRAARRIAWLREQQLPRFPTQYMHRLLRALHRGRLTRGDVGHNVERLRWTARLAAFESLPPALRDAETAAVKAMFETCAPAAAGPDGLATRALCLGRVVDDLRRLGYLRTLSRAPAIARELAAARDALGRVPLAVRYRILVGMTLAHPGDIALQRMLLATRRTVAAAGDFPAL